MPEQNVKYEYDGVLYDAVIEPDVTQLLVDLGREDGEKIRVMGAVLLDPEKGIYHKGVPPENMNEKLTQEGILETE